MIADSAEDIIVENGYEVCGIARTVAEGVALARLHKPDLAIVDLRLADDELGTEVAAQLVPRGKLGILYATGNISQIILSLADGQACLPFQALSRRRPAAEEDDLLIEAGEGRGDGVVGTIESADPSSPQRKVFVIRD
jgi:CheY-like chemotaxis protein